MSVDLEEGNEEVDTDVLLHKIYCSQQVVDHNDSIFNVAPLEGYTLLGLFKDKYCEEMCFPTLFFGEPQKYHELALKKYQAIAKWELMNENRKFSLNIENLFFKAMKIMTQKNSILHLGLLAKRSARQE